MDETLRLGSAFHGLHAITTQIAPLISGGIEKLETEKYQLNCFQSLTGFKFILTSFLGTADVDTVLHVIYELFADYVLKNPFYEMDMPIRCDLFNQKLDLTMDKVGHAHSRKKTFVPDI